MENKENIPSLSVDETINTLYDLYFNLIKSKQPYSVYPGIMLWGKPGVGKSQLVRSLAKRIEAGTNKKIVITDLRLNIFSPVDIHGVPTTDVEKKFTVWLKPKIFDMDESNDIVNFLFLDEISSAAPSVQAVAYQIVLDRTIGEHHFPDNCIIIGAGNRVTDKAVAYNMPSPLANRFCHFKIESNFSSWKSWAIDNDINPKVVGFLSFRTDYLMGFDPSTADLAFPTPRSWEMVSNILNFSGLSEIKIMNAISGCIGMGAAAEFVNYCRVYDKLPSIEDIFNGKEPPVPKGTDILYALVTSMVSFAKQHSDNEQMIRNSVTYATQMPADYAMVLMKDYLSISPKMREMVSTIPSFTKWRETKGRFLNGII